MKIALITGAALRIGRAIAIDLASRGWAVAIHHNRSQEEAEELVRSIKERGGEAIALRADICDHAAVSTLLPACRDALGAPVLLVNNASHFSFDDVATLTAETWQEQIDLHVRAPVFLSRDFAKALPAGEKGCIVNILDQRVWKPTPQFFSYAISKAALWQATLMSAQALAPRIRVNGIGPGPTLRSIHQAEGEFDAEAQRVPLGHGASPDEIAAALLYLIDARSVTGQMIAVDGGQHLAWLTPDIIHP